MIYADSIVLPRVLFTKAGLEIELDVQYTIVGRHSKSGNVFKSPLPGTNVAIIQLC